MAANGVPILYSATANTLNITGDLLLVPAYTATADCLVHMGIALSSMTAAAANITLHAKRKSSGGTLIMRLPPNPSAVAKYSNSETVHGDVIAIIPLKSGEILEAHGLSSATGDTAVSATIQLWNAASANVHDWGGSGASCAIDANNYPKMDVEDIKGTSAPNCLTITGGSAGGIFIAGSNAATTVATLTSTGAVAFQRLVIANNTSSPAVAISNSSGGAMSIVSTGGNGTGIQITGYGTGQGVYILNNTGDGHGLKIEGGSTDNSYAMYIYGSANTAIRIQNETVATGKSLIILDPADDGLPLITTMFSESGVFFGGSAISDYPVKATDTAGADLMTATAGATLQTTATEIDTDLDEVLAKLGTPAGASLAADVAAVKTDSGNLLTNLATLAAKFTGITLLAQWLGLIAGKQVGNSTARTELRASGAGSGTYDETTDSLEALKDTGTPTTTTIPTPPTAVAIRQEMDSNSTQLAAIRTDIAEVEAETDGIAALPTAAQIDTQLSGTHGSGAWGSSGSGTGAYTVTITVNDGTAALQNAFVRLTLNSTSYTATTNASGVATFSLDAATYPVAMTCAGYSFTPTTLVVSGATSHTYSMTAVVIAPATPPQTNGFLTTTDGFGNIEGNVVLEFRAIKPATGSNEALDAKPKSATAAANGILQIELRQGAKYAVKWPNGVEYDFVAGSDTTFAIPSLVGKS